MIYYSALGVVVIAATALVAARSPRQSWIWHICLLAGLGMSATGAVVIEHFKSAEICDNLGFWSDGRCLLYNIEESLEFLGIWLTLVAMLGQFSDAVPSPQPRARLALYILPAFVFVQLLLASPHIGELETYGREVKRELSRLALQLDYQLHFQPASVYYELDVELQAYRIEREQGTFTLQFFASIGNWRTYTGLGYSLHLVDQVTGESIVGTDASASRRHSWRITDDVWVQRIEIHIPSQIPTNRALWIVLTLWRNEGAEFVRQKIISSDHNCSMKRRLFWANWSFRQSLPLSRPFPSLNLRMDSLSTPSTCPNAPKLARPSPSHLPGAPTKRGARTTCSFCILSMKRPTLGGSLTSTRWDRACQHGCGIVA